MNDTKRPPVRASLALAPHSWARSLHRSLRRGLRALAVPQDRACPTPAAACPQRGLCLRSFSRKLTYYTRNMCFRKTRCTKKRKWKSPLISGSQLTFSYVPIWFCFQGAGCNFDINYTLCMCLGSLFFICSTTMSLCQ